MSNILEIRDLTISVENKAIIQNATLSIKPGETVALFGPNGSGKTTLLRAIIGMPGYKIESGSIVYKGNDITRMPMDARARMGMGIAFQRPPVVRGVRVKEIMRLMMKQRGAESQNDMGVMARKLNMSEFLDRDLNLGFSGGEIKRSELLQVMAQSPDFIMLDEPDSGVDIVSMQTIGSAIEELLQKSLRPDCRERAGLIITHTGHILDYVNADRAYVLIKGRLYCSGNPRDIMADIKKRGFEGCAKCTA